MNKNLALVALLLSIIAGSGVSLAQPVTTHNWQEAVVSVTDLDRTARFFTELGGYEIKWRGSISASELTTWGLSNLASGEALLLGQENRDEGFVRLVRFDNVGTKMPTRPGARSWDTGCYFSLMVRMKDMQSVYEDAIKLGWWTETPITQHTFGDSKLNIMVFQGPDGIQVQAYERLSLPIPKAYPEFERFSAPFNIMQMVKDRDVSYEFFTKVLQFGTFYHGKPYLSKEPEYMPLSIPINLTTRVRYRASMVHPLPGELSRMEMIEIMDLDGRDYSSRCNAPNLGILAVRFPVDDIAKVEKTIRTHNWPIETSNQTAEFAPYGEIKVIAVKTPDGANIQFYQKLKRQLIVEQN